VVTSRAARGSGEKLASAATDLLREIHGERNRL